MTALSRTSDQPRKAPKVKARKCRICRQQFMPWRSTQPTCDEHSCQHAYAMQALAKKQAKDAAAERKIKAATKKADRERLIELQRPQYFLKKTEKAVNALVRERDREQSCISCGTHDAAEWHAGHFIPVGRSSFLRYDLANIHKQCDACNVFGAGKATEYERRLIGRIGQAEVDRLKSAPRLKVWSREELAKIEADAKAALRELKGKA